MARFVPFVPPVGRFEIDRVLARWRHMTATPRRQLYAALLGASRSDLPPPELLRTLDIPTLVIGWGGDPVHPQVVAEKLASLLPDARLHIVSMPAPETIGRLIGDFCAEVSPAVARPATTAGTKPRTSTRPSKPENRTDEATQ